MTEGLKHHLPVIIIVSLIGIATGAFILMNVASNAADMSLDTFSLYVFVIPCIIMAICSLIIMMTASEIGRRLFVTVTGICFAVGVISMVITSSWFSDPTLVSQLLANSPEGTTVTPPIQSPLIVMRNIAAYIVAPTVGSILGAWIGSRMHPMKAESGTSRKKKGR